MGKGVHDLRQSLGALSKHIPTARCAGCVVEHHVFDKGKHAAPSAYHAFERHPHRTAKALGAFDKLYLDVLPLSRTDWLCKASAVGQRDQRMNEAL